VPANFSRPAGGRPGLAGAEGSRFVDEVSRFLDAKPAFRQEARLATARYSPTQNPFDAIAMKESRP
jgi:hypothetical protein